MPAVMFLYSPTASDSALPPGGAQGEGAHAEEGQHDGVLPVSRRQGQLLQNGRHQSLPRHRRHGLCPGRNKPSGGGPVTTCPGPGGAVRNPPRPTNKVCSVGGKTLNE